MDVTRGHEVEVKLNGGESIKPPLVILFTSADIEQDRSRRHSEYIEALRAVTKALDGAGIQYRLYALETYLKKTSILDNLQMLCPQLIKLYSKKHKAKFVNKGANLVRSLRWFFGQEFVSDQELVLLMTGRYSVISEHFFNELEPEFDFMGKLLEGDSQVHTGFFVMRARNFREFLKYCNPRKMEKKKTNIENLLRHYLHASQTRNKFLNKLDVIAPIFGNGEREIVHL